MKTLKIFFKTSLLIFLLFFIHSCVDYHVTTTVNPDGSLDRVIKVSRNDSGAFDTGSLFLPTDSSWVTKTEWEYIIKNEDDTIKKFVLTAQKHFKNFHELNEDLLPDSLNSGFIQIETSLVKKFRWFYTYLKYTEIYKKYFPFSYYPIKDFISETEIEYLFNPDDFTYSPENEIFIKKTDSIELFLLTSHDSIRAREIEKNIETKFNEWMGKNAYVEFSNILAEGLKQKHPELEKEFISKKDSIYELMFFEKLINPENYEDFSKDALPAIAEILQTDDATLYHSNQYKFDNYYKKLDNLYDPAEDNFSNTVIMPGILISSNSHIVEGNTCTWEIEFHHFFAEDYKMYSESKIVNQWAITLSLVFVSLLLVFLFAVSFKRKKSQGKSGEKDLS